MQPKPRADTSLLPNLRFCIVSPDLGFDRPRCALFAGDCRICDVSKIATLQERRHAEGANLPADSAILPGPEKLPLERCVGAMCVPEGFEMAYAQDAIGTM